MKNLCQIIIILFLFLVDSSSQHSKIIILQDETISFSEIHKGKSGTEVRLELMKYRTEVLSSLNVYYYALSHGYEYKHVKVNEVFFDQALGFHRSWLKLFAIYQCLASYDYVLYLSSKYYFSQPSIPLLNQIIEWDSYSELFLLDDYEERVVVAPAKNKTDLPFDFQTNFLLFKNTQTNLDLLRDWILVDKVFGADWKKKFPYELAPFKKHFADQFPRIFLLAFGAEENVFLRKARDNQVERSKLLIVLFQQIHNIGQYNFNSRYQEDVTKVVTEFDFYIWTPLYWISIDVQLRDLVTNEDKIVNFRTFLGDSIYETIQQQCDASPEANCTQVIDYIRQQQEIKREEVRQRFVRSWAKKFIFENSNFQKIHQLKQQELQFLPVSNPSEPSLPSSGSFKTIVTIFAGRKDRLNLLMKYLRLALKLHIISEVHLWDYCREYEDRKALFETYADLEHENIFIQERYTSRLFWFDYYEHYDYYTEIFPNDIIIKCDDDVVFIDVMKLPSFISAIAQNEQLFTGVVFSNTINNGVAAYLQQNQLFMLPQTIDDYEYPTFGLCGSLWESGEKANRLHDYFLAHWESLIRPAHRYEPEVFPICTRFSINFFGVKGRNWYKLRDVGVDDELHISVTLPQYNVMRNYMYTNLVVSHLSFGSQKEGLNIDEKLQAYEEVYRLYVAKYANNISSASNFGV